ncbi:MAG: M56 family metallopeptidase [Herbinix sp.]|nr:M56 family metallopeptidase [Herbinix sp.]
MNDTILIVLSLSISGSFMALLLFVGKPIVKKHVSRACSYYIWILVLLRIVIPFSFDQSIMNQLFNNVSPNTNIRKAITVDNAIVQDNSEQLTSSKVTEEIVSGDKLQQSMIENNQDNAAVKKKEKISVQGILAVIWLAGSCIALLLCVIQYIYLKVRIKDTNTDPDPEDITILHNLCSKKIRLKYNSYVSTPMLIGIISPCIVIPGSDYVKNGNKQELENILCHELMHYRRKDLIYKWFTVVVTSLHWFNPLMIPIRRQISRTCELSCDEAVIRTMNVIQKRSYGETLLSMAGGKKLSAGILATTLCEEKKELEERLLSIMKYKKQTAGMLFLSVIIVVMLTGCGIILGSVSKADTPSSSTQKESSNNDIEDIKSTGELKWYGATSLISEGTVLPSTIINSNDAMDDFCFSDRTIALLAVLTKEDIYVYGLKENGSGGEEDYSYYCHGICIRQGNEIQVLDIDWGIYGDIPQIQYEDYDNDGQKELAMILRSASGTDLSLIDLHIFEKSDDGGLIDNHFTDWADQLSKLVTYEVDENGILKIFVKGEQLEQVDISTFEDEWGEKFKGIAIGNNVKFLFEDGKIYLHVLLKANAGNWVTPQIITETYVQMEVQYNDGFELLEASSSPSVSESDDIISSSELDLNNKDTNNIDTEKVEVVISDKSNMVFEGNIGTHNICMAIYREGEQLTASFITQNDEDSEINLQGTIQINTASFALYSEDNDITFIGTIKPDTAEGELLEGNYTSLKNEEKTSFTLACAYGIGNSYETRYPLTTSNTEDVEEFARTIKSYVIENNKKGLAELVDYPIKVTINALKVSLSNAEEFEQNYDDIMNAEFKEKILNSYTKYMNSNYMGIMLGNGEIWFDNWNDKGLRIYAINN